MATNYKLTWKKEQGGRWRKRYKGRSYTFKRLKGESKEASYRRCWALWLKKKEVIDNAADEPWHRAAENLIAATSDKMRELAEDDTPENREAWNFWNRQLHEYRKMILQGTYPNGNPPTDTGVGSLVVMEYLDNSWKGKPPWEENDQAETFDESIDGTIAAFLKRKQGQVERGDRSAGRYEVLRVGLDLFVEFVGRNRPVQCISTAVLSRFRDHLEAMVEDGKLQPATANTRLQTVKQWVKYLWELELIDLPRILNSRDFNIVIPETSIKTFTVDEIQRLLGAATNKTRLYLLLMLNTGMQQQDIAELMPTEVDWKAGRITRKRSKTRKHNSGDVPTVSYPLWSDTFDLLKRLGNRKGDLALTNEKGGPLKVETIVNGRTTKVDNIRSAYQRLVLKLGNDKTNPMKINKQLKLLRKTAASTLGSGDYSRFAQHFLGHAPGTVADKHYVVPDQRQFDAAVAWLGMQFR